MLPSHEDAITNRYKHANSRYFRELVFLIKGAQKGMLEIGMFI